MPLHRAVLRRYRNMEAYPRCFARFKMMADPMFKELPRLFDDHSNPKAILDIGTGYGVPACWLLERFPNAKVYGIDPDGERVRVASRVVGRRGEVKKDAAPHVPAAPAPADAAVMLDMIHYLPDDALALTLERLYFNLMGGGKLLIRVAAPGQGTHSWLWKLESVRSKFSGIPLHYRPIGTLLKMLTTAGFRLKQNTPSGSRGESVWLMAEKG